MSGSAPASRSGHIALRMVRAFGWLSLAVVLVIWIAIHLFGDRSWWSVMLLFGPRWLMVVPWLGVVPWLLAEFRRAIVPSLLGLGVALFGIVGFHLGLRRAGTSDGIPFRVVELNAQGGTGTTRQERMMAEIRKENPDVAVVVECGPELVTALKTMTEFQMRSSEFPGLCLLSRTAITGWEQRGQRDVFAQGGAGYIVRAEVTTAAGPIRIGLVHLATPRHALDSYFDLSELPKQGNNTLANMAQRDEESRFARDWILQGPLVRTIVAGDFNLPAESAIYRRYWGNLRNAFGRAGFGTGYTKRTRRWGVRIDHVLTSDDIGIHSAIVGPDVGSDHRPVITDLVLPRPN